MTKKEVKEFLETYGTKVSQDETSDYVELMMDDHVCIRYYGTEYYIPENNMFYTSFDEEIREHLTDNHHV